MDKLDRVTQPSLFSPIEHNAVDCTCSGKICRKCEQRKCILKFNRHCRYKGGRRSDCKVCTSEAGRKYNLLHQHKRALEERRKYAGYDRVYEAKRRGLDGDFEELFGKEPDACAICGNPETAKSSDGKLRHLALDHDHVSGQIRDFLCYRCNTLLGRVADDAMLLHKMADYLEYHKRKAEK